MAEYVEQDSGSQRVTYHMHFPIEFRVSLLVEIENTIAFPQHNLGDLFPVRTLV